MPISDILSYPYRYVAWNMVGIGDYKKLPFVPICKSGEPFSFPVSTTTWDPETIRYRHKGKACEANLNTFLDQTGTTALIIIKSGEIVFEAYGNGYTENSINTSFSVAKSITSLLIGIALEEGLLASVHDSIKTYLPDLPEHYENITVHHLLNMCSGLSFEEGIWPWKDDPLIYYGTDLRSRAHRAKLLEEPGTVYHYNNYNLLLLGLLLEKVTGTSPATYMQKKIWSRLGAEADASWSADSKGSMFAKMESGFNATAKDFAKLAFLCLNKGRFRGQQLVPEKWLQETFNPPSIQPDTKKYLAKRVPPLCQWAASGKGFYHNLWWGYKIGQDVYDTFALGVLWQLLYLAPRKDTVIVRFGKKWGNVDWWPQVLKEIVDDL